MNPHPKQNKMKTNFVHRIGTSALLLASILIWSSCTKDEGMPTNSNLYMLSGNGNGSQVVPSVSSSGSATISGSYNPTSRLLKYTSTWSGLSGTPTSSGFYSGLTGMNGTAAGMPWAIAEGSPGSGTFTGSVYLTPEQANELTTGGWYYSFSTASHPDGEVRGQITAVQE